MKAGNVREARPDFIAAVVSEAKHAIGRTAVMKFVYFLQNLRGVPLGYRFSLYTYGPFDQEVLADLAQADGRKLVKSTLVPYPNGNYGYEIEARAQRTKDAVEGYRDDIRWVLDRFGGCSASELEMLSTIVFVDRSSTQKDAMISLSDLARKVHNIKPHLAQERIEREARRLTDEGLLLAVA
jgi:uncharacterized protein